MQYGKRVLYSIDRTITTEHCVGLLVTAYQKKKEESKPWQTFCELPNKISETVY